MATHHTTEKTLVVIKKHKKRKKKNTMKSLKMLTKSIKSIYLLYGNTPYNKKQTRRNKIASDLGTKKTRLQVLSFESPLLGKTKRRRTDGRTDGRTDRQTDGRTLF